MEEADGQTQRQQPEFDSLLEQEMKGLDADISTLNIHRDVRGERKYWDP